jgi:hypothetical protein
MALVSGAKESINVESCFCELNFKRILAFAPVAIEHSYAKQEVQSNKQKLKKYPKIKERKERFTLWFLLQLPTQQPRQLSSFLQLAHL